MDQDDARTAKESLELVFLMSYILGAGLDRHTLCVLVAICDLGLKPKALAVVVKRYVLIINLMSDWHTIIRLLIAFTVNSTLRSEYLWNNHFLFNDICRYKILFKVEYNISIKYYVYTRLLNLCLFFLFFSLNLLLARDQKLLKNVMITEI